MFTVLQIKELIRNNRLIDFYNERYWRHFAKGIMHEQHDECQLCKAKGRYSKAECLHHVKHLDKYPELAYCRYYIDEHGKKQRQLVALCKRCHNDEHDRFAGNVRRHFQNPERW